MSCSSAVTISRSRCLVAEPRWRGGRRRAGWRRRAGGSAREPVPDRRALEEVEGPGAAGDRVDGLGRQHLDGLRRRSRRVRVGALDLVGQPQDGDRRARRRTRRRRRRRRSTVARRSNRRRTRLRDSASAGNASSASNAAVRRRPWPSLWRRWARGGRRVRSGWHVERGGGWRRHRLGTVLGVGGVRAAMPLYRHDGRVFERPVRSMVRCLACSTRQSARRSAAASRRARGAPRSRRSPATRWFRRSPHGSAGTRCAAWRPRARRRRAARASTCSSVERLGTPASAARASARASRAAVGDPLLARLGVVGGTVEEEADQRPEVGQRLDLLLRRWPTASRSPRAAGELPPGGAVSSSVRQLAQVAAVQAAQLLLVEHRRVLGHALETEALGQLVVEIARRRRRPSRAARCSCAPPRAGSRRRAAPGPRRRRGAWTASCRRGRAAAAGARRAARLVAQRLEHAAAAWACWRGGPRRGRRG